MELTINNIQSFLQQYSIIDDLNFSNGQKFDFNEMVTNILNEFYPEWKYKNIYKKDIVEEFSLFMHPKCRETIIENVVEISFVNFYAQIMLNLTSIEEDNIDYSNVDPYGEEDWDDDDKIYWNIPEYFTIFKFLVENKTAIKLIGDYKSNKLLDVIINITYSCARNTINSYIIQIKNGDKISKFAKNIVDGFIIKYPDNVFYTDTDQIFFIDFNSIENEVLLHLKEIGFKYEVKKINTLVMFNRKKYIQTNDINLYTRGFKKLTTLSINNAKNLTTSIDDAYSNHFSQMTAGIRNPFIAHVATWRQ